MFPRMGNAEVRFRSDSEREKEKEKEKEREGEKRILAYVHRGKAHIDATCSRAGMFISARAKFRLREINIIVPVGLNLHCRRTAAGA